MKRRSFLQSIAAVVFGGGVALKAKTEAAWHFVVAHYNGNDKPFDVYLDGKKLEETSDYPTERRSGTTFIAEMPDYAAKYTKSHLRVKRLEGLIMQEGYSIEKCLDDNHFFIEKIP